MSSIQIEQWIILFTAQSTSIILFKSATDCYQIIYPYPCIPCSSFSTIFPPIKWIACCGQCSLHSRHNVQLAISFGNPFTTESCSGQARWQFWQLMPWCCKQLPVTLGRKIGGIDELMNRKIVPNGQMDLHHDLNQISSMNNIAGKITRSQLGS